MPWADLTALLDGTHCQWGSAEARALGRLLGAPDIAIRPASDSAREQETHDEVRHEVRGYGWRSHGYRPREGIPGGALAAAAQK